MAHTTPAIHKLEFIIIIHAHRATTAYHGLIVVAANMASMTNADDNDKNIILFVSILIHHDKYFISVCLAIVWSLRYRLALRDQIFITDDCTNKTTKLFFMLEPNPTNLTPNALLTAAIRNTTLAMLQSVSIDRVYSGRQRWVMASWDESSGNWRRLARQFHVVTYTALCPVQHTTIPSSSLLIT